MKKNRPRFLEMSMAQTYLAGNSTCHASPRCTLWQVFAFYRGNSFPSRSKADIVGRNNAGEKVYLRFGINKAFRLIRPGMWITVWRVGKREEGDYTRAIIKLNN